MNICIAIICAVNCCVPAVNNNYIVSSNSEVRMAATIHLENEVIVALVTTPIFTKSDRVALMKRVATSLAQEYGYEKVTVTMDSDIYSAIELNTSDYHSIERSLKSRGSSVTIE